MLADSVEAAARSLSDPTPVKLRNMVRKIINAIFMDGQLDDCELTLKDLNAIAEAFINVLTSMYHSRPEYPEIHPERTENGGKKDSGENSGGESGNKNGQEGNGTNQTAGDADNIRVRV
jgi:cyclic-di-AMP phosphodiesterase PgpH